MSDFGYAREQIGLAVHELATKDGSLKERLMAACLYVGAASPSDELPSEVKTRIEQLHRDVQVGKIDGMTAEQVYNVAQELVALHAELWEVTGERKVLG